MNSGTVQEENQQIWVEPEGEEKVNGTMNLEDGGCTGRPADEKIMIFVWKKLSLRHLNQTAT